MAGHSKWANIKHRRRPLRMPSGEAVDQDSARSDRRRPARGRRSGGQSAIAHSRGQGARRQCAKDTIQKAIRAARCRCCRRRRRTARRPPESDVLPVEVSCVVDRMARPVGQVDGHPRWLQRGSLAVDCEQPGRVAAVVVHPVEVAAGRLDDAADFRKRFVGKPADQFQFRADGE